MNNLIERLEQWQAKHYIVNGFLTWYLGVFRDLERGTHKLHKDKRVVKVVWEQSNKEVI